MLASGACALSRVIDVWEIIHRTGLLSQHRQLGPLRAAAPGHSGIHSVNSTQTPLWILFALSRILDRCEGPFGLESRLALVSHGLSEGQLGCQAVLCPHLGPGALRRSWANSKGCLSHSCHFPALGRRLGQLTLSWCSAIEGRRGNGDSGTNWVGRRLGHPESSASSRPGPAGERAQETPSRRRTRGSAPARPQPSAGPAGATAVRHLRAAAGRLRRGWFLHPPPRVLLLLIPPPPAGPSSSQPSLPAPPPRELDVRAAPGAARPQQPPPPARCARPRPGRPESRASPEPAPAAAASQTGRQATSESRLAAAAAARAHGRRLLPGLTAEPGASSWAAMRPSWTVGAALLLLLAAHFPARRALEEKKGKGVPAAPRPAPGCPRTAAPRPGPREGRRCVSGLGEPAAAGAGDCGRGEPGCGERAARLPGALATFFTFLPARARPAGVPARASQGLREGPRESSPPLRDLLGLLAPRLPLRPARGSFPGGAAAAPDWEARRDCLRR